MRSTKINKCEEKYLLFPLLSLLCSDDRARNAALLLLFSEHPSSPSSIMSKGLAVVLAELNYECLEVHYPRLRLIEAGYTVQVAGPKAGETYTSKEGIMKFTNVPFPCSSCRKDLISAKITLRIVQSQLQFLF